MVSEIAWLSFDAEQQRRLQLALMALEEKSAIDELGMGLVRDLIAGTLHPNLTVLLTRARYLVLLPNIYAQLSGATGDEVRAAGKKAEGRLIRNLIKHYQDHGGDDRGIIGKRRGERTKQPASNAYWPLMQALGISRASSVGDFCEKRASENRDSKARRLLRSEDDPDLNAQALWLEFPKIDDAQVSFELDVDEAQWVRQRFLDVERDRAAEARSLIAWMLSPERDVWISGLPFAWDHPQAGDFPASTAHAMRLGRDADTLIHGARITYNYLCAMGCPESQRRDELIDKYRRALNDWRAQYDESDPLSIDDLDRWGSQRLAAANRGQSRSRWLNVVVFLRRWQTLVDGGGDLLTSRGAADLITAREKVLKPGRARLADPALLADWQGDSGYFRFDYNWGVANRLLADIHKGLGTPTIVWGDDA